MDKNNDKKIAEYNSLRQEILHNFTCIKDYRSLAYTVAAAVLSFSFSEFAQDEPFISLIPIFIILPLFLLCAGCYSTIAQIGAYLNVFYYDDGFEWERRQHFFEKWFVISDKKTVKQGNIKRKSIFIVIIIVCGVISLYKSLTSNYNATELIIRIMIIVITEMIPILIIIKKNIYVGIERVDYVKKWMLIKEKSKSLSSPDCGKGIEFLSTQKRN